MGSHNRRNQNKNQDQNSPNTNLGADSSHQPIQTNGCNNAENASNGHQVRFISILQEKKWNRIEVFAAIAVGVNIFLSIYTYKLFHTSVDAVRKAEIADSTAISALNTNKEQFTIINQPYLEMIDVSFNGSHNGKLNIGLRIRDLNNIVVNSFKQGDTVIYRDDKHRFYVGNNYLDSIPAINVRSELGIYNSTLREYSVPLFSKTTYSDDFYNKYKTTFKDQHEHFYLLGRIYYNSDMSPKNRIYEYVFEMIYQGYNSKRVGYSLIYSKNRDE